MSRSDAPQGGPSYQDPERYAALTGFRGGWRDLWWNEDFLALMAQRLELKRCVQVLDVGAGAGHWGFRLLPHLATDATVTGVDREADFANYFLEQAATREAQGRASFVVGEAESLPFADDSFDLVTCQTVLIHVADAEAVVREMARVTRPGGQVLAVEPDNRAGKIATVNGYPSADPQDLLDIFRLLLLRDTGKLALGEGDDAIGGKLPGVFARAGLKQVRAFANDRCNTLVPPYEHAAMKLLLDTELEWAKDDISVLCGAREDARRFVLAAGGSEAQFEAGYAAVQRWLRSFEDRVEAGDYDASRGYLMYLCAGVV